MRVSDQSSYTVASYKAIETSQTYDNASWWNYGREIWCNLEGQYTTIVADLTSLTGAYEMSLCNVSIMGTQYVRDDTEHGDPNNHYAFESGQGVE